MANTLWAMAVLKFSATPGMSAPQVCRPHARATAVHLLSTQNIANTAWALACLEYNHYRVMNVTGRASRAAQVQFQPQQLSRIAWALSVLSRDDFPLMDAIAAQSLAIVHHAAKQRLLALTAWSYAELVYANRPVLDAGCAASARRAHAAQHREITMTAWAIAMLAMEVPRVMCAARPQRTDAGSTRHGGLLEH
eukprot:NODE_1360_length_2506_cov_2.965952.p2 GENE.NODE_1360_length_2506_cov_2.965952~~NODE_1360_length_2506_cov_2.965952.p2  ORF type:complete len:194 (-),score=23.70 NODE_1360_length_2506_cov_2.965952:258-839(-)